MPLPAVLAGIVAGAVALIQALGQAIGSHPVLAYFLILTLMIADGGISYGFNIQGVFGTLASYVINTLGVPIQIYSWQLLILMALSPIIFYVVKASVQS